MVHLKVCVLVVPFRRTLRVFALIESEMKSHNARAQFTLQGVDLDPNVGTREHASVPETLSKCSTGILLLYIIGSLSRVRAGSYAIAFRYLRAQYTNTGSFVAWDNANGVDF